MPRIKCYECGAEGSSKCPHCRSIFSDERYDSVMSHLIDLSNPKKVTFKVLSNETQGDFLVFLKEFLGELTNEQVRVCACMHQWEFMPCQHSSIGCGHGSEEKPLQEFMDDVQLHLLESGDVEAYELVEKIRKYKEVAA